MHPIQLFPEAAVGRVAERYAQATGERAWISPSVWSKQETLRSLAVHGAVIEPGVRTLAQFGTSLLVNHAAAARRLTPPQQADLIERIVGDGLKRDVLDPVRPLAASGALARLARRVVNQLRADGVAPKLARSRLAAEQPTASASLAWIYWRYCEALDKHALCDDASVVWLAADVVAERPHAFAVLHAALRPYTSTELALARATLGRAEQAVLIATAGPGEVAAAEVAAEWGEALGRPVSLPVELPPPANTPATLTRLRTRLFDSDATAEDPEGLDSIEVLACSSPQDEVRRVVARVKLWLAERSAASAALAVDDVVIAVPGVDYAERLRLELAAAGIPSASDHQPPLSRSGWWRLAQRILTVDASDWRHDDLIALCTRADVAIATSAGPAERFLREAQAPSGRGYLLGRVAHANDAARVTLHEIDRTLRKLPGSAEPLAWFDAIAEVIDTLGWSPNSGEAPEFEVAAHESLERALSQIEASAAWRRRSKPVWTREEFARWMDRAPEIVAPSPPRTPSPAVRVARYDNAATLSMRRLAVVGVGEAAFSTGRAAGADITNSDLEKQAALARRRFYALVTRPTEYLLLSYAALDAKAQAARPCPYVEDLERLFPSGTLRRDRSLLQPVPRHAEPVTTRALRLRAIADATLGDAATLATLKKCTAVGFAATRAAVKSVRERASGDRCGSFEGVVTGARDSLADRFGAEHPWSASQLQRYASCAFRFFARDVLRAEPIDSLELSVDRRRRGSRVHQVLAELHKQLEERTVPLDRVRDAIAALYTQILDAGSLPEHQRPLAAVERLQVERWLEAYPEQTEAYAKKWSALDTPMTPQLFEARFGVARRDRDEEDARSVDEPLTLDLPRVGPIRVEGTIDRVDVGEHAGTPVFAVVDYKTSRDLKVKPEHVELGLQLQPVLYALAAIEHFLADDAMPLFAGYWGVRVERKAKTLEPIAGLAEYDAESVTLTDKWTEAVDVVKDRIARIVEGVRAGEFPLSPTGDDPCKFCDYRRVCRVSQARAVGKLPESADERSSDEGPAEGTDGGATP
ncbi:MAG: PD-(D/E)XK nuclease family protein [Planctomycetota bacterium]